MRDENNKKMKKKSTYPSRMPWIMSVRNLMVAVVVIGGYLGHVIRAAHRQREVVAFLKQGLWSVDYSWDWKVDQPVAHGKPWAPDWLVSQLGVDYFGHVYSIGHTQATDLMLKEVEKLDQLDNLNIFGNEVTDVGVERVGRLKSLRSLYLNGTSITHAGMAHLEGLTRLRYLGFQNSNISDASLVHLKGMSRLEFLSLNTTRVSDAGLVHLARLTNLQELALDNTNVSDAGLVNLRGLRNLTKLWLGGTNVTAKGAGELQRFLPRLEIKGVD